MIKATYRNLAVEVLDTYEADEVVYAVVRALRGQLFVEWGRWPVKTEYATVLHDELREVTASAEAEPKPQNLLALALAHQGKQQWSSGESVWLWGGPEHGAYLKVGPEGIVRLWLTGFNNGLNVFLLNHKSWQWEVSRNLGANYYRWVEQIREAAR